MYTILQVSVLFWNESSTRNCVFPCPNVGLLNRVIQETWIKTKTRDWTLVLCKSQPLSGLCCTMQERLTLQSFEEHNRRMPEINYCSQHAAKIRIQASLAVSARNMFLCSYHGISCWVSAGSEIFTFTESTLGEGNGVCVMTLDGQEHFLHGWFYYQSQVKSPQTKISITNT